MSEPKYQIAQALYAKVEPYRAEHVRRPAKGRAEKYYDEMAQVALDALADAGYVLVQTPSPNYQSKEFAQWNGPFLDVIPFDSKTAEVRNDFEWDATFEELRDQGLAFIAAVKWMRELKEKEEGKGN